MFKNKQFRFRDIVLILLILAPFAWAGVSNFGPLMVDQLESSDTYIFTGKDSAGDTKIVIDTDGHITIDGATKYMDFDLNDFRRVWTGTEVSFSGEILGSAIGDYPYIKSDVVSAAIVWPQYHPYDVRTTQYDKISYLIPTNEESTISPIGVTFKVPPDYRADAAMSITMDQDATARGGSTTTAAVRFGYRYFLTTPGNYFNQSATKNPYVQIGTIGNLLSPTEVTFAVSASEAVFEPGKWVTFQYWRIRDESVVDKARHLAARFSYSPEY